MADKGTEFRAGLLTLAEAAAQVRLSPWALRRAVARGELRAYKPAGKIRIPADALTDWLTRSEIVPERATTPSRPLRPSPPAGSFRARARVHTSHADTDGNDVQGSLA